MRQKLVVVPRAGGTAQGAEGRVLTGTGGYSTMLGTSACYCGPGRTGGPRYVCLTCAGFARIGRRIEARAPHLHTEARRA